MLQTKDLFIGYKNNCIMKDLNYQFDNKIYGILGASGLGKTTLLKTLAGLIKPIAGEVILDGNRIINANKNGIYMMHQSYTCFNWLRVDENVYIARKIQKRNLTQEDIDEGLKLLEKVGLGNQLEQYPQQLSGGMRQRLALARTLYANPKVILMDEPLSALDQKTRKSMQDLLMDYQKANKSTIIMVTHSKEEAKRMCDQIIEL